MPNKNKWQIHKVAGRWIVRLPNYIGPWLFTFSDWNTCLVFMDGVEIYYHNHPDWHFTWNQGLSDVRHGAVVVIAHGAKEASGKG